MKLLVDTSVWSLALRRKDPASLSMEDRRLRDQLAQAIQDARVAIIGPIRQELLSGLKDQSQFNKLKTHLGSFLDAPLLTADFEQAAQLYNACRTRGVQGGTVDMLICAVATRRDWQVLTSDQGLQRCWEISQDLQRQSSRSSPWGEGRKAARKATGRSPK